MERLLARLRAVAEPTRLRLLALCADGELTVTELAQILGQSQPRVSRHLKLLCGAGLLDRFPEGNWVFYRLAQDADAAALGRALIDLIPDGDSTLSLDLHRLERVKEARAEAANAYFRENAPRWNEIRSLHVPESEVERVLLDILSDWNIEDLLDIGTGAGRMLELFAPRVAKATGMDRSHEMLAVARTHLERAGLRHCQVRHGDMYQLPLPSESFDAVVFHQVLHFADNPPRALSEAARALRPGGVLLVADFAPHDLEDRRRHHAHRRLGFAEDEVEGWLRAAGLRPEGVVHLPGDPLTVSVWTAIRPGGPSKRMESAKGIPDGRLKEVTT
ncbi:MAG TPA: metalloregulator ArsR/SmtB family transcription factor [Nitrospinota bacterium]|nr:metalloregulator ArsR/SmtB family transcription factor [Nitrospinota bacterium]